MSCLATKRLFGGRRASVGDAVLLAEPSHDDPLKTCLHAGVIVAVSRTQDRPYIFDLRTGAADFKSPDWTFVDAGKQAYDLIEKMPLPRSSEDCELALEAAIESMPVGSWTWKP